MILLSSSISLMISLNTDLDVKNRDTISCSLFWMGHFKWYSQYGAPSN